MITILATNKKFLKETGVSPRIVITNGHVYEIKMMKICLGRWESLRPNQPIEYYSHGRKLKGGFPMIIQRCG
jgi:hypothetical protein